MLNFSVFQAWRHAPHRPTRAMCAIAMLCALCVSHVVAAAELPDASKPGGAQAGSELRMPVPPNMRRFLATPEAEQAPKPVPAGTQIEVTAIVLEGVVERPEHDIRLAELNAFVEQHRQRLLASSSATEAVDKTAPLSAEDRDKLLNKLENSDEQSSAEETLEALEQTIQDFRRKSGRSNELSLAQLQEIAAQVAQYYQQRGFILVKAVIPPQTIQEGRVHIRVLEGILGNVSIEKNRDYNREQMLRPFTDLVGQPVTRQAIETAMLLLNDYPGLETFAVFRPGLHPGETDLLVSVLAEKTVNTNLHFDNYGSEYTGEYRTRLDVEWNNLSSAIDRLRASYSKTYDPQNGSYGSLYYERKAFGPRNLLGVGASSNHYSLGSILEPFGISGTTTLAQAYWRRAFHRSRLFNSYGLLQLSRKSAKLDVTEGEDRADELTVFSLESGFNWAGSARRHMANGRLQYHRGVEGLLGAMEATSDPALTEASRRGGSGAFAGGGFSKLNLDYDHWYSLTPKHMLHLSLRGQYSQDLLASLEQMAIGGPNSVRAYPTAAFLRDSAVSTSIEWLMQAPGFSQWKAFGNRRWGEVLQVSLFMDYAKGWLNDPLASDREEVSISGIGAGLRFNYEKFSARFEFASPLGDEPPDNDRDPQYFLEMNYGF